MDPSAWERTKARSSRKSGRPGMFAPPDIGIPQAGTLLSRPAGGPASGKACGGVAGIMRGAKTALSLRGEISGAAPT
jgi:hypothetical protein